MLKAIFAGASLMLVISGAVAVRGEPGFTGMQKSFIQSLFREKRYFDCVGETRRLLHHEPSLPGAEWYGYFIGANYFLAGQYGSAAAQIDGPVAAGTGPLGRILRSQALLKLGDRSGALVALANVPDAGQTDDGRYELLARRADILLSTGDYGAVVREIESQRRFFSDARRADSLLRDALAWSELGLKSRGLAMAPSAALPGAGQLYAGRFLDGFISLAAVAAAGAGALAFHRRGDDGLAYTMTFFTALFYGGSIIAAGNAADAASEAERRRFEGVIRTGHIPPYDPLRGLTIPGIVP